MPVPLRQAAVAIYVRRLWRIRNAAGNWMRLILAAALFYTAFTALLTRTIHLFLPNISGASPFASTVSYSQASIIPPVNSTISDSIANSDTRLMESKGSDIDHMMQVSRSSETQSKELISRVGDFQAYTMQESHKEEAKPHNVGRKVPFWALPPFDALQYAKREIEHAPLVNDDPDLYAPIYWNLSAFKRVPTAQYCTLSFARTPSKPYAMQTLLKVSSYRERMSLSLKRPSKYQRDLSNTLVGNEYHNVLFWPSMQG